MKIWMRTVTGTVPSVLNRRLLITVMIVQADKHAMRAPPCLDSCHELCPQLNFLHKEILLNHCSILSKLSDFLHLGHMLNYFQSRDVKFS